MSGIVNRVVKAVQHLDAMPRSVRDIVGTKPAKIARIFIVREAIGSALMAVIRRLPGSHVPAGKVLYHLYMILQFDDGTFLRIDKDEIVKVRASRGPPHVPTPDWRVVSSPPVNLATFFDRGESVAPPGWFWRYDATRANCQYFVIWCLKGVGQLTTALRDFVLQTDVPDMFTSDAKSLMRYTTDAANIAQRMIGASGAFRAPPRSAKMVRVI